MKRNVGAAVTFVLGALLLSAAVVTYWGENMVYTYELTFLSNTIAGAVLLAAALGLLAAGYSLYFSNRLLKKFFCAMGKRRKDHGASH